MIEITGADITALSDTDLRSLIGLLCEAELRTAGLSTAGVTWGGHQNAKDGGIDVRVEVSTVLNNDGFIPRSSTGFQVKKPDMPRAAIIEEMRRDNQLRQVIKDLADVKGAYIIVSSQGSTADLALMNRKAAMQEAISDYINASQLKVDFYDRERIAGWVRAHPALILWVREKIGRPLQGWKTYGNWANCPGGVEEEYITDGHVRLFNVTRPKSDGLSIVEGINELRSILGLPRSSVRLVGLSGVGKTRLVQSLFDGRIGENPLNPSQVLYADISDSPFPDPRNFAEILISHQKPLSLIIDNCPPDLHRRLTSLCSAAGSLISLLTVEYDVKDDQPEETEVFRLEPASNESIEKVVLNRYTHLTPIGAKIIAEFAGGNARIAIALAKTVERGEDISQLRDNDLFERLFQQRNTPDSKLLKVAEVCSLVYSFDIRTDHTDENELQILGSLIDLGVREIYENISELKRRDLVQQRSHWRAVLPHAVANRLAKRALQNIPANIITDTFFKAESERLLKSFSRRLGYLHNSEEARGIAREWLSEEGLLGDVINLNQLGVILFRNIAPVDPEGILSALESVVEKEGSDLFFSRENDYYNDFTRLLRSIAYDPALFERSTKLLCRFALAENPNENINSIRSLLKSLFYIYLSGTHASPEQRLEVISSLLGSDSENSINLGLTLLDASLEAWHFSSYYEFEFGSRARDYGWSPNSKSDINHWYSTFLDYMLPLTVSDESLAIKLRGLLAEKFRGLWTKAAMYDELEGVVRFISSKCTWNEGWTAVKRTLRFDAKVMEPNVISKLNELAEILAPTTIIDRIRLYTFSSYRNTLDLVGTIEEGTDATDIYTNVNETVRLLGQEVGSQIELVIKLLPELLSHEGNRIYNFGKGLAQGSSNPRYIWDNMLQQLSTIPESERNYQLLRGFLNALSKSNINLCEDLLNEIVTEEILCKVFPFIQTSVDITEKGLERLKQALELRSAPIWMYKHLAYGRALDEISDNDFCDLLRLIASENEGKDVAIEIFQMRIFGEKKENISKSIISLGQELLVQYSFLQKNAPQMDYELANIVKCCFSGEESKENVRIVATKIAEGLERNDIFSTDFDDVMSAIASTHPLIFLDIFLAENAVNHMMTGLISRGIYSSQNPISTIKDEDIITWCSLNPEERYPKVASIIVPYRNSGHGIEWTPLAYLLIRNAPDPILVLNQLKNSLRPSSWEGSRADIMQTYVPLLLELQQFEDPIVSHWSINAVQVFREEIRSEREWELSHNRELNERFE